MNSLRAFNELKKEFAIDEKIEIGRGSFGRVYKMKCKMDNKFYAVKLSRTTDQDEFLENF